MAYKTEVDLTTLENNRNYKNAKGEHQCVELVQGVTNAPRTADWKRGVRVLDVPPGLILVGTVIATFDENGKYPLTARHAAIYLSHNENGIEVCDQWKRQGMAKKRTIRLKKLPARNVNDAQYYYLVE